MRVTEFVTANPTITELDRFATGARASGGSRADHAGIASTVHRYEHSQTEAAILTESARHCVLEIGERMHELRLALRPVERACNVDLGMEGAAESLIVPALHGAIDPYLAALGRELGFPSPDTWRAASRYFHKRFGKLIDLSPFAARCFYKPLGYAGDFEMMNMCYRNESLGETLFGRSLSRLALDSDAAKAVRHRGRYLAEKIETAVRRGGRQRPARILSVAAGPRDGAAADAPRGPLTT
jgi:extracellular factor (EF) 3-hydroxypalmitic acid methyl ester biosynthesis protein